MAGARACFCLSKARGEVPPAEPEEAATDALRAELAACKPSALRSRAADLGITQEQLAEADDADEPRVTLVHLILAHRAAVAARTEAASERSELAAGCASLDGDSELVDELRGLKLMALSKRALSMGVGSESVDEAMEADDAKSALITLIVEIESSAMPHHRR
jgi:hypothetical protein